MNAVSMSDTLFPEPGLPARRILALSFPCLATDRIRRARLGPSWRSRAHPELGPLACAERAGSAFRIVAADEVALARGVKLGQGVAEARAICPALEVVTADPEADRRFLDALADWADRYTPLVGLDEDRGLYLDIAGCAHLFGGEAALMADCLDRLFHLGVMAQAAIAPTPGLAWALARYAPGRVAGAGEAKDLVRDLPVPALRLAPEEAAALARVGLRRVGDLVTLPRAPLARRFGAGLVEQLDRITGAAPEPISPRRPVAALMAERRLAEPVIDLEAIDALTGQLAEGLREGLERRGAGAREMELSLFRVDGAVRRIRAGTARPLRDPRWMRQLFSERLAALHEEIDAGYGFETIRLSVAVTAPFEAAQADFSGKGDPEADFSALADRLAARLGRERVLVPSALESHVPERAALLVPHGSAPSRPGNFAPPSGAPRPVRLFGRPEPVTATAEVPEGPPITFRWRRSLHRVARAEGPERIAPEWWIDGEAAPARDYYRVEDEAGRRYWLFREGLYERDPDTPRWFVHGLLP